MIHLWPKLFGPKTMTDAESHFAVRMNTSLSQGEAWSNRQRCAVTRRHTHAHTHLSRVEDTAGVQSGLLRLVRQPVSEGDGGFVDPAEHCGVAANTHEADPHVQKLTIWWTRAQDGVWLCDSKFFPLFLLGCFYFRLTWMKVGADHLFSVDGVKGGEGASSIFHVVTVLLGFVKAEMRVLHQLITPAVPRNPARSAHRLFICRRFCGKEEHWSLRGFQLLQGLHQTDKDPV